MVKPRLAVVTDDQDQSVPSPTDTAQAGDTPALAQLRALQAELTSGGAAQDDRRADAAGDETLAEEPAGPTADSQCIAQDIAPDAAPEPAPEDLRAHARVLEALLFASAEPLDEAKLAAHLPAGSDVAGLLGLLADDYRTRGVNLVRVAGKWAFRTAEDLSWLLEKQALEERRLSKAALETLAIIAYHQPVTRAEIEAVRGVATSKGTLDVLLESGWIRPRGRRRAPGKPITYGTSEAFLDHFGLDAVGDLPGLAELKGAGLLDGNLPPDFKMPEPKDVAALMPDELPLEDVDEGAQAELELDEPLDEDAAGEHALAAVEFDPAVAESDRHDGEEGEAK